MERSFLFIILSLTRVWKLFTDCWSSFMLDTVLWSSHSGTVLWKFVSKQSIVSQRWATNVFLIFDCSFITSQFYDNWKLFGPDLLRIDLKPFGKANVGVNIFFILILSCDLLCSSSLSLRMVVDGISSVSMDQMSAMVTRSKLVSWTRCLTLLTMFLSSTASWALTDLPSLLTFVWRLCRYHQQVWREWRSALVLKKDLIFFISMEWRLTTWILSWLEFPGFSLIM